MSRNVQNWPKIILFGDSITQHCFGVDGCWGALLADFLQRKCDVINRGFSGYNVRFCRYMLPQLVTKEVAENTAAVTIFLGANDSNDFETNPRQHVPLAEYREGLTAMVDHLLSVGVSRDKIIMISPPAFNAPEWEKECVKKGKTLSKNNKTTEVYAKACVDVGKECGVHIIDFYTKMMNTPNWESLLNDGLHLSTAGSNMLFSMLQPVIEQLTANIPAKFPWFDEVDLDNLKSSLVPFKE